MLNGRTTCSVKRIVQYYIVYISRLSDISICRDDKHNPYITCYRVVCFCPLRASPWRKKFIRTVLNSLMHSLPCKLSWIRPGWRNIRAGLGHLLACLQAARPSEVLIGSSHHQHLWPILTIWPVIIACCTIRFFCFLFLWRVLTLWTIFLTKLESRPPGNWCWDVSSS